METEGFVSLGALVHCLPEVEIYVFTLIVTTLMREGLSEAAAAAADVLMGRLESLNRRSLDALGAKVAFYFSLTHEKIGKLEAVRPRLLSLYRSACVHQDQMTQSVALNLLLRNYLHFNQIDQAEALAGNTDFPENASNNQFCRYLYYMGRILAIRLEYSNAYQRLMTAMRKAPQEMATGFTQQVQKLIVLVQLLMGEVPDRAVFNQPECRAMLEPYFHLTLAVKAGDYPRFQQVTRDHAATFQADKCLMLVKRLGHNVIKTGLKRISVSYSRISFQHVAEKLHLASAQTAEYLCAKAIR